MNSLDHIEKLIQMTAIEQMYSLIQKMKNDMSVQQPEVVVESTHSINKLNERIQQLETQNDRLVKTVNELMLKINSFETEFQNLQTTNSKPDNQLLPGQTLLTNYSGFMKNDVPRILEEPDTKTDVEHIRLKIEDCVPLIVPDTSVSNGDILEPTSDEPEYATSSDTESEVHTTEEQEEEEEIKEEPEEQVDQKEEIKEEEEQEEEQEEEEELEEEQEEEQEEQVDQKEEEQDDEEEVFEIEIDDVTYFATDEENGILYAVTKDGDVGDKVGILRDGEPIFM